MWLFLSAKLRVWAFLKVFELESNLVKLVTWGASIGVVRSGAVRSLEGAIEQWSPTFLAPGTGFAEDDFSMDLQEVGWFKDDVRA